MTGFGVTPEAIIAELGITWLPQADGMPRYVRQRLQQCRRRTGRPKYVPGRLVGYAELYPDAQAVRGSHWRRVFYLSEHDPYEDENDCPVEAVMPATVMAGVVGVSPWEGGIMWSLKPIEDLGCCVECLRAIPDGGECLRCDDDPDRIGRKGVEALVRRSRGVTSWPETIDLWRRSCGNPSAVLAQKDRWFVTTHGLETLAGDYYYVFEAARLKEADWYPHLCEKEWGSPDDVEWALRTARSIHKTPGQFEYVRRYTRQSASLPSVDVEVRKGVSLRVVRASDVMEAGVRKALVKFFERDGSRAVWTNADNPNDFLLSAALQMDVVLPDNGDKGRADMLADWLPQIVEIAAKLKGYKADVYEERVIIAGRWRPDEDAEVLAPESIETSDQA